MQFNTFAHGIAPGRMATILRCVRAGGALWRAAQANSASPSPTEPRSPRVDRPPARRPAFRPLAPPPLSRPPARVR